MYKFGDGQIMNSVRTLYAGAALTLEKPSVLDRLYAMDTDRKAA